MNIGRIADYARVTSRECLSIIVLAILLFFAMVENLESEWFERMYFFVNKTLKQQNACDNNRPVQLTEKLKRGKKKT